MLFLQVSVLLLAAVYGNVHFGEMVRWGQVTTPELDENSGLGLSRVHDNIAYGHNDHGDTNRIFALNVETGALVATLTINGAIHHDWEDLSVGPCGGEGSSGSCIYIADVGGRGNHTIYKVREPTDLVDSTLDIESALPFTWTEPDGEGMVVDPNGEVYAVSRVSGGNALFAKLPSSAWGATDPVSITDQDGVRLNLHTAHHDPLGADLSPDGKALLLKGRVDVYYYAFDTLDYITELPTVSPQIVNTFVQDGSYGEAIAWVNNGRGFFVLPEGNQPVFQYYAVNGNAGGIVG